MVGIHPVWGGIHTIYIQNPTSRIKTGYKSNIEGAGPMIYFLFCTVYSTTTTTSSTFRIWWKLFCGNPDRCTSCKCLLTVSYRESASAPLCPPPPPVLQHNSSLVTFNEVKDEIHSEYSYVKVFGKDIFENRPDDVLHEEYLLSLWKYILSRNHLQSNISDVRIAPLSYSVSRNDCEDSQAVGTTRSLYSETFGEKWLVKGKQDKNYTL